jgi:hypothetical protein
LLEIDRLGQVVEGAGLERLDRVLGRAVGGHDDAALGAVVALEVLQDLHAQAVGQAHVGDDGVEAAGLQVAHRLGHAAGGLDPVALAQQREFVQDAQVGLVVDDQDARGARRRGGGDAHGRDCVSRPARGAWRRRSR